MSSPQTQVAPLCLGTWPAAQGRPPSTSEGLVTTAEGRHCALHVVGRRHALAPAPQAGPSASGRLVLIALRERFEAAAVDTLLAGYGAVPA